MSVDLNAISHAVVLELFSTSEHFRSALIERVPEMVSFYGDIRRVAADVIPILVRERSAWQLWFHTYANDFPETTGDVIARHWETYRLRKGTEKEMVIRGPRLWRKLHRYAFNWNGNIEEAHDFLRHFDKGIGCGTCQKFWRHLWDERPAPLTSSADFFNWTIDVHNQVNQKLGKPVMNYDEIWHEYDSSLEHFFERVVVINLDRREDRMKEFNKEIEEMDWPFHSPERVRAIDGNLVGVPNGWTTGGGAWGCMSSHRRILEDAILDGVDTLLVLEDDVTFAPDFKQKITEFLHAVPKDWDQLMIGGQLFRDSQITKVVPGVVQVTNCQRTHCYAVRGKYMKDLYAKWQSYYGHCDHCMGPFQEDYKVYAPENFLAGQRECHSDINDAHNPTKFWTPPPADAPVYWVRGPREVVEAIRGKGYHFGRRRTDLGMDVGLDKLVIDPRSPRDKVRDLKNWITMIQWEGRSMKPECFATIWHPDIPERLVKGAAGSSLVIIDAEKLEDIPPPKSK